MEVHLNRYPHHGRVRNTGEAPLIQGTLPTLQKLLVFKVEDAILHFDEIGACPSLEHLELHDCFGIRSFDGIERFPKLQSLTLGRAAFSKAPGSRPPHLGLRRLTLIGCRHVPAESLLRQWFPNLEAIESLPFQHEPTLIRQSDFR